MSQSQPTKPQASVSERIDAVADRFEAAWKGDVIPVIADFLEGWEGEPRQRLQRELAQLDRAYRERRGLPIPTEAIVPLDVNRDAPTTPARIGRYRLGAILGAGSFGTVYRAFDEQMQREVALKVLRDDAAMPGDTTEAFLREARVVAQLHHPHVVTVHDAGEADGCKYIVYELVDGESLRDRLRQPLLAAEAACLLAPVADALHHAHTRGLLHRDVKPANILVDRDSRARLIDFGLGIREQNLALEAGRLVGSYAYLPPEMVRGEGHRLDGRGDIYSLGVVLYEALCGRRPFRATRRDALFDEILNQEPKPPRQLNDAIPAALERVCLKAMAKRISERYTTALDLAADLRACAVEDRGSHSAERGVRSAERPAEVVEEPASCTFDVSRRSAFRPSAPIVPRGLRPFGGADADFFLDLLPGPRERDGLPESVHFWKSRIATSDGDSFRVGLIVGPSGCGKSSLVRAGLLPRLSDTVVSVYAEAERDATETRLRERLQRACPDLNPALDLPAAVTALRRGVHEGRKVLIVLDQLEQWLQACGTELGDRPLVAALRQADGDHVQFLLLVRDDYWLGAARLFRELELPLREGENLRVVDLFDARHARRVLRALGEAHGAIRSDVPVPAPDLDPDLGRDGSQTRSRSRSGNAAGYEGRRKGETRTEMSLFLDDAVRQLGTDGKVIPVRLSLFAELMKSRPWTRRSLREVGGIDGLGVTFLEETFASRSAHPEHRRQAPAARAVLAALLPEEGDVIRGRGRCRDELLGASGLGDDHAAFDHLLETLDRELRLITPAEGDGGTAAGYQLAHDYLVPAVRQWLRQHEQTTWRGRARLRLTERAAHWARHPESRFLPSLPEFVTMIAGVPRSRRQPAEQAMLRAAARRLSARGAVLAVAVALIGWGIWEAHGRIRARGMVEAIESATLVEADRLVNDELPRYRRWAEPRLHKNALSPDATRERRLRASLAYVAERVDFLTDCLLDGSLAEVAVIRARLVPFAAQISPRLLQVLNDGNQAATSRFRAALALAVMQPGGEWACTHAGFIARQLAQSSPDEQAALRALLRPIGPALIVSLRPLLHAGRYEQTAAQALADFASAQPATLAEVTAEAAPEPFAILLPALAQNAANRAEVLTVLEKLAQDPDSSVDAARRRAGAIVTLYRLASRSTALDRLSAASDAETRAQFVSRVHDAGIEPALLAECLENDDGRLRQDLILALGEYASEEVPTSLREHLARCLADWYREDDRPGVHAACGWLLRRWGLIVAVAEVDQTPCFPPSARRGWFVRRVGSTCLTFAILRRGEAPIGSPENEMFHVRDEVLRTVTVEESVAFADREVTVGLWNEFLRSRGLRPLADAGDLPARDLSWYEAIAFCRWLTTQAGMSEADQCYRFPAHPQRAADGLITNWEFDPERPGFRLPTDAEWEAACRAGVSDTYSFGNDSALLDRYGWFLGTSERRPRPVATRRPNRLGLFDMHGNVWEWCQDEYSAPKARERASTRVYRGGSFDNYPRHGRSACRINDQPAFHFPFVGLRVVFTLPDADRAARVP
jgi:serine/threonine protein kinase/formylglycine-generating enzyme required for sulfatase activity